MTELLTENLPPVRCKPSLKSRLQLLAQRSITRDLSDHIRFAVERYVSDNWTPALEEALLEQEEPANVKSN